MSQNIDAQEMQAHIVFAHTTIIKKKAWCVQHVETGKTYIVISGYVECKTWFMQTENAYIYLVFGSKTGASH